jgi:hypothetical protein
MPFPYLINTTHSVQPGGNAQVFLRNERWQPVGLLNSPPGQRSAYVGIPLDALPHPARNSLLNKTIGWLSPVGGSALSGNTRGPNPGESVALALDLRADVMLPVAGDTALVTWSFSNGLSAGSNAADERVPLEAGASRVLNAGATVNAGVATGTLLTATATIRLEKMGLAFQREWVMTAGGPRLSAELAGGMDGARFGGALPMTATIINTGASDAVRARIVLPAGMSARQIVASSGAAQIDGSSLIFAGTLTPGARVTITFLAVLPPFTGARPAVFQPALIVYDSAGNHIVTGAAIRPVIHRSHFAIMAKNAALTP